MSQRFFKVEALQEYSELGDPSYGAFLRGDFALATRLVEQRMREQAPFYEDVRSKRLRWIRVRVVRLPLTDYIAKYEFAAYHESSRLGEEIRFVDEGSLGDGVRRELTDYLQFDNAVVLVHNYDESGTQHGGWVFDDADSVACFEALSALLLSKSESIEEFEQTHSVG